MPPIPVPNPSWLGLIILSLASRFRKAKGSKSPSPSDANGRMPTYSVLVPAYNEEDLIGRALESCAMQTVKPERVIILDDNGSCDYWKIVASVYPQAEIIRSDRRQGKALNIAKNTQGIISDYVLVLDADSFVDSDFMQKILGHAPFDVASGTVNPDPESTKTIYGRHRLVEYMYGQVVMKRAFNLMGSPNIAGCFAVYKTDILKTFGLPSRTVTEDLDLCWEVLEKKGKVIFAPEARGYTHEPQSYGEYSRQVGRWYSGFWQCVKVHGAEGVGEDNRLALSLNFVFVDQLIIAPIWFAFLLGSILTGLSDIRGLLSFLQLVQSNFVVSAIVGAWHRWFPFATNILLFTVSITFDISFTSAITLYWAKKQRSAKAAAKALPFFYFLSWYNRFVFWASALKTTHWKPEEKGTVW